MADNDVRIPKGILKNKYGSNPIQRDPRDITDQIGVGSKYGGSNWEPPLGMIGGGNPMPLAPVPAPQHGMNMPNPILDPVMRGMKSELQVPTSQKLHEFINNKRDLLFRPLDPDEMPMSDVKGTQRNTEDHCGIVPSFDHFLRVDKSEVLRYFFQNVQVGDVVVGKVLSRSSAGLYILLLCCEGGKHMILDELNVRAFCHTCNVIPISDPRDPSRYYEVDDHVRVEVIDINKDTEKILVGMKGSTLSQEMQHSFQLGWISRYELPRYYLLSKTKNDSDPRVRKTYQDILLESPGFQNPNSVSHLASNMGIYNNSNSLMTGIRSGFPAHEKASQLRRVQNGKWAHGHVAEGIKNFKLAKYPEAFQSLNNALNIDAENVEALVARGALYANNGNYEKAIDDFESALKFNPSHFNARKYLAETLVGLGRQQEGNGKLEDAIASYSKSLVVRPDHNEAKEALWSLHTRTEKLDTSKMMGPAAAKAAELKAKLKTILQQELGFKMDSKLAKDKKSKKDKKRKDSSGSDDDSSSSSSSDESSSDSSSSESGYKKKSKKRKKKKSRKSKKSRKESENDQRKQKEMSLSPFSKRLTDPSGGLSAAGTGFSGLMDSTYAELQLGITKKDKIESDDEDTKRSSKKNKDKKRSKKIKEKKKKKKHMSSDSSSSDSESERSKKKSKTKSDETPLQVLLPDLGDLEAKLSAYYSKIEQKKIDTNKSVPRRSRSRSRSRSWGRDRERRKVSRSPVKERSHDRDRERGRSRSPGKERLHDKVREHGRSRSPVKGKLHERDVLRDRSRSRNQSPVVHKRLRDTRDFSDIPPRVIENVPPPRIDSTETKPWSERKPGKIDLQTDEYGNMVQTQIVCTVKNDIPPVEPPKVSRFEMKFKPMSESGTANRVENGAKISSGSSAAATPDTGSKWRPLGAAVPQSDAMKTAFELDRGDSPPQGSDIDKSKPEKLSPREDKGYRKRSRSSSRSPSRRRRRSRSVSKSRSRSRSRSRSSSRSRSRSPYRRDRRSYGGGYRGRPSSRFFRGYNHGRGGIGVRRPFGGRSYGGRDRDFGGSGSGGGGGRSRFRNRFSRTPSRSRSRSRSYSPRDRRRGRSRSRDRVRRVNIGPINPSPSTLRPSQESGSSRVEADSVSNSQEDIQEIQIGGVKTSSAADLEVLLDRRNAEKKEEMRKSNPDFFRTT